MGAPTVLVKVSVHGGTAKKILHNSFAPPVFLPK